MITKNEMENLILRMRNFRHTGQFHNKTWIIYFEDRIIFDDGITTDNMQPNTKIGKIWGVDLYYVGDE